MDVSSLTTGFLSSGNTFPLTIFSMTSGTVMTSCGLTWAKASRSTFGEGTRPRNVMLHPLQRGNRNSKTSPYIWASGSMLSMPSPGWRNSI